MNQLTHLYLQGNRNIGLLGCKAIADSVHLVNLKVLNLSQNDINNTSFAILAESTHLKSLTELDVSRN